MPSADGQLIADVTRVATSVCDVVGARAAMVSRVLDDEWLEVMAVAGEPSAGITQGLRWRRADLDRILADAEKLGRLHLTKREVVTFVEVPDSTPETVRSFTDHGGLLVAPLLGAREHLLGVLMTEGPVEIDDPKPGVCELVELYAEQVRLVLGALRDRGQLAERLRMSHAAHEVVQDAAAADDLPGLLDAVARNLGPMMRAEGAWVCADLEPGVPADAAAYPEHLAERLSSDAVCTLLEPMIPVSVAAGHALTHHDEPVLGRVARVVGMTQALLAPIGDGTGTRGALIVLRGEEDGGWTADENEAFFALGQRIGTFADQVLERVRDQETLEQLQRLDASRRDLVASITHDIKTPLTAISLNTELLESDGRLAEAGSHPVEAIRRSADRLSNLVDDLLTMARTEEGAGQLVEVDLVQMLREACAHVETEADLRQVTFDIDTPEELYAGVDDQAVARVLANLASNAVKFSLPRGRVRLRLARVDGGVEFTFADEGIGMPADRVATIFDIARRAPDSRADKIPGSGIGLVICARIVDRLGGEITVDSTPGEGSTFVVRLPC